MEQMNDKIRAAIKESLPQMVGEELLARLSQADEDAGELARQTAYNQNANERLVVLQRQVDAAGDIDKRDKSVTEREAKATARETKLELSDLRVQLAQTHLDNYYKLALAVFANNQFKYSEYSTVPI